MSYKLIPSLRRQTSDRFYRYGHNGQEKSAEINKNSYTAEFWQYDARIVRRWNIDPVLKEYESPYLAFAGNPIWFIDVNGSDTLPASLKPKEYTNRFASFSFFPTSDLATQSNIVLHSHVDAINEIFSMSGGDDRYSVGQNVIDYMNKSLKDVVPGTILISSESRSSSVTNLNCAFYSAKESGSEKAWINALLGGFIAGTVPENIVFW